MRRLRFLLVLSLLVPVLGATAEAQEGSATNGAALRAEGGIVNFIA